MSDVKADWYSCSFSLFDSLILWRFVRLIECAANYFDLKSFPEGDTKNALTRAWSKRAGQYSIGRQDGSDVKRPKQKEGRELKKRKAGDGRE